MVSARVMNTENWNVTWCSCTCYICCSCYILCLKDLSIHGPVTQQMHFICSLFVKLYFFPFLGIGGSKVPLYWEGSSILQFSPSTCFPAIACEHPHQEGQNLVHMINARIYHSFVPRLLLVDDVKHYSSLWVSICAPTCVNDCATAVPCTSAEVLNLSQTRIKATTSHAMHHMEVLDQSQILKRENRVNVKRSRIAAKWKNDPTFSV